MRQLIVAFSLLGLAAIASAAPVAAAVILDDTWRANGGSEKDWSAGFGPAMALAAKPQFAAVIGMGGEDQSEGYRCTGTWLGNDDNGHAFVLTAAHCVADIGPDDPSWIYWTEEGTARVAVKTTINPLYAETTDELNAGSYDLAVVELDGPIEDSGEAPVLYDSSDEFGFECVVVGYGTRGTGQFGEDPKFNSGVDKAAFTNKIDFVETPDDESQNNRLAIDLDRPGGRVISELAGSDEDEEPVDALEGISGGGDSGGPMWIQTEGGWRIVGLVSRTFRSDTQDKMVETDNGLQPVGIISDTGSFVSTLYGYADYYTRVSQQLDFIRSVFPDVQTGE